MLIRYNSDDICITQFLTHRATRSGQLRDIGGDLLRRQFTPGRFVAIVRGCCWCVFGRYVGKSGLLCKRAVFKKNQNSAGSVVRNIIVLGVAKVVVRHFLMSLAISPSPSR